jgi:hypothetical protein
MNNFKLQSDAIRSLYNTVVTISKDESNNIVAKDQNGNDVSIDVTAVNTKATELENAEATDKANGNQKLLDLGLSQAEATALTGYTPPSEV